jgi:hypothetical protein
MLLVPLSVIEIVLPVDITVPDVCVKLPFTPVTVLKLNPPENVIVPEVFIVTEGSVNELFETHVHVPVAVDVVTRAVVPASVILALPIVTLPPIYRVNPFILLLLPVTAKFPVAVILLPNVVVILADIN